MTSEITKKYFSRESLRGWRELNTELIEIAFRALLRENRNEYVFKTLLVQFLKSKDPILSFLGEFRSGHSRIDVLSIGEEVHAYEIKTDLDSLDRLESQLRDYSSTFEKVSVVCGPGKLEKLKEILEPEIGIILLNSYDEMETIREATSCPDKIDTNELFYCFNKPEYITFLSENERINTPNTKTFKMASERFEALGQTRCRREFLMALRKRASGKKMIDGPLAWASIYYS